MTLPLRNGEQATVVPPSPGASSPAVRSVMQGNSKRGTRPERALRSALHARGLRFRIDLKIGDGRSAPRPDVVFQRAKVAVFVDGCYWHSCPDHGTTVATNGAYWSAKLARNRRRDAENNEALERLGWLVIRVWEHDDVDRAAEAISAAVHYALQLDTGRPAS